jgi:hypothetical protein
MYSLGIVTEAFLGIILTLDSWIYSLISSAYKIFMAIASARILSSDAYTAIANKVYIIIGVGMLFVLAYAIMKAIIDPDQMSKGDMAGGKILKSIAIAVIGLIVTPLIFDLAYMAQGKMLEDDILGKIFFRTEDSVENIEGYEFNYDQELHNTGGAVAATSVWQAFFYPADGEDPTKIMADPDIVRMNANIAATACAGTLLIGIAGAIGGFFTGGAGWVVAGAAVASCVGAYVADSNADQVEQAIDEEVSLAEAFTMVSSGETGFAVFQAFIEPIDEGQIKYTWFISTVCGAFVAYAFVSYAIDMGLRAAKLAYYQIIAPIPLILGVLPKNGDRVGKFAKAVFSTFLEVFVRISVVYIVIYIIAHLNELFSTVGALWDSENLTTVESMIAMALLIIGLVLFAKQAPKIISDTFGLNAGGLEGLNIMKKLRDGEVFTAGTVAGSALKSGVNGFTSNFRKTHKTMPDGSSRRRGMTERLFGGMGSAMYGAAAGGIRSGVGRARSGKPVGGVKEMRDHIGHTADDVAKKRKSRQEFFDQNPSMTDQAAAKWSDVKASVRKWAVGEEDMTQERADMKFAGDFKGLQDTMREEAFKKDSAAKALKAQKEQLEAEELDIYAEGWSEDSRIAELRRRMLADATYQARERAYVDAKKTLGEKDAAVKSAEEAYKTARDSGVDAATLSGLESRLRAAQNERTAAQTAFNSASENFKKREAEITADVDAVAKVDEATLTRRRIEKQDRIRDLNDKAEAAADRYIADELRKEDSIIRNMAQTFVTDNAEYISANSSRRLTRTLDANGNPDQTITVGDLVSQTFGDTAVTGAIITGDTVRRGNSIKVTYVGAGRDGADLDITYNMEFDTASNSYVYVGTDKNGNPVRYNESQIKEVMVGADKIKTTTRITEAADTGKQVKKTIPLARDFIEKSTRIKKDKEKK